MMASIEAIFRRIQVQFRVPFATKSSCRQRTKLLVIDGQNQLLSEQDVQSQPLSSTATEPWIKAPTLSFYEVQLFASIPMCAGRSRSLPFQSTHDLLGSIPIQCFVESWATPQKIAGIHDNGTEAWVKKVTKLDQASRELDQYKTYIA